jgi:hypothetical protein
MLNNRSLTRRQVIHTGLGVLVLAGLAAGTQASPARHLVVYKSPSCGCCGGWTNIVSRAGFLVEVHDRDNLDPIKKQARVPEDLAACHTAVLGNYVVEGHVPIEALEKLLAEQPPVHGIAVPGMPAGSPGMGEDATAQYDVIAFTLDDPDGRSLFMRIGGP